MTPCTEPKHPGDERYVYGLPCTWHGLIAEAGVSLPRTTGVGKSHPSHFPPLTPCCPHCGCKLAEMPNEEAFWHMVAMGERLNPGYEDLMRWGRGRCFPDGETLENAYRQAMEGQD